MQSIIQKIEAAPKGNIETYKRLVRIQSNIEKAYGGQGSKNEIHNISMA